MLGMGFLGKNKDLVFKVNKGLVDFKVANML